MDATYIDTLISVAAYRHDVDEQFIRAVIKAESAFNVNAESPKGARANAAYSCHGAEVWCERYI